MLAIAIAPSPFPTHAPRSHTHTGPPVARLLLLPNTHFSNFLRLLSVLVRFWLCKIQESALYKSHIPPDSGLRISIELHEKKARVHSDGRERCRKNCLEHNEGRKCALLIQLTGPLQTLTVTRTTRAASTLTGIRIWLGWFITYRSARANGTL